MRKQFEYDVFLSYSSKNKKAVLALADRLQGDSLQVRLNEWPIKRGRTVGPRIKQGLERSRTIVVCMSQAYFDSAWGTLEYHTLLFRDPTNTQRRFLPLLLEDCTPPDIIAQFAHVDWRSYQAVCFRAYSSKLICTKGT